jgi:hypothetical protein
MKGGTQMAKKSAERPSNGKSIVKRSTILKVVALAMLLMAASPINQVHAQAEDSELRNTIYGDLNWSAGDHGYNEGALCGVRALEGVAGVQLPEIPFEENALGNIWDRTNMMGAAVLAYSLGYTDQAVEAATCSQIHNDVEYPILVNHPDIVADWLGSH